MLLIGAGLIGAAAAGPTAAQDFPVATDVRLGGDGKQTRFVLDLTRQVGLHAFTLADPYRVVVDIPQVVFQLSGNPGARGRGLVKSFRYGLVMRGGSRIVLDLTGPVRIDKAFALPAADGQPARLVLDLVATDRESFLRTIALENRAARTAAVPPAEPARPAESSDKRPVIVIDPGHGGIDEGTHAPGGITEKAIVLEFGRALRDRLEKSGKYRVVMTRNEDVYVPLAERVRFARQHQAALLISLHADALPRGEGDARGATVYTLSDTASDAEAARLAEAENRADIIAGVDLTAEANDVADILIDLARRETRVFSAHFAHSLVSELKPVARLHKNPMRSAGFRVLRAPDVPSVLVELGYVSNRDDLRQLTSEAWRARTADAITRAVDRYFLTRLAGTGGAARE